MSYIRYTFNEKEYVIDRYLADVLKTLIFNMQYDWDIVIIISGDRRVRVGKCLDIDTKLYNGNKLSEYKDNERIKTVSYDFKNGKFVDSESIVNKTGKKQIYEIELEDGRKISCTSEHKLFTFKSHKIREREVKSLKKGDYLLCKRQ